MPGVGQCNKEQRQSPYSMLGWERGVFKQGTTLNSWKCRKVYWCEFHELGGKTPEFKVDCIPPTCLPYY